MTTVAALAGCSSDGALPPLAPLDLIGGTPGDAFLAADLRAPGDPPDLAAPPAGIRFVRDEAYVLQDAGGTLALGDLDGDRLLDAVLGTSSRSDTALLVLYGRGGGKLLAEQRVDINGSNSSAAPAPPVLADLNGDGRLDAALPFFALAGPEGTGAAGFAIQGIQPRVFETSWATFGSGQVPPYLVAGDFDGDGRVDLLADSAEGNPDPTGLLLLRGNGDGSFLPGALLASTPLSSMSALDLDGDGRLDVVGTDSSGAITTLLNGRQGLTRGLRQDIGAARGFGYVVPADLNGDGHPDLVGGRSHGGLLIAVVLPGRGDGTFGDPQAFVSTVAASAGGVPVMVVSGDFDGDRHPDVALAEYGVGGRIAILQGAGDGTLAPAPSVEPGFPMYALAAGDLDRDGLVDLALVDLGLPDRLVIYLNTTAR